MPFSDISFYATADARRNALIFINAITIESRGGGQAATAPDGERLARRAGLYAGILGEVSSHIVLALEDDGGVAQAGDARPRRVGVVGRAAWVIGIAERHRRPVGNRNLIVAAERARQHGFTQSELDRAKKLRLNAAERRAKMQADYRNSHYVNMCVNNFLEGEPLVSADFTLENTKKLDAEVTLAEVNAAVKELITDKNQVVVMYAPDKDGFEIPSEQQIEQVILAAQQQSYAPYTEEKLAETLVSNLPKAGSIVSEI